MAIVSNLLVILALIIFPTYLDALAFTRASQIYQLQLSSLRRKSSKTSRNGKRNWDDLDEEDSRNDKALNLITQQSKNYEAIRKVSGASLVNDIYVRDSSTGTFWFIGKVARVSDVSLPKAVEHQWPMIEEHAGRLQPSELDSKNRDLEIWCAPGDTELEVAYNNPETIFIKMRRNNDVEGSKDVKNVEVGFKGEMYEGGEEGFRTWRNEDGTPTRPQIKTGGN